MYKNSKCNDSRLITEIMSELKYLGVKCCKEKALKKLDKQNKVLFGVPLELLELGDVILANGSVVEIPKFIAEACSFILENVKTEGIFRKAGSALRQKEIRISLQNGHSVGKDHHVIDIANIVKYFLRELPQPIISTTIQEALMRSLLIGNNNLKAIMLVCLLMQPIARNTLAFFMQFLHTVSSNAQFNKMNIENLAIVLTPSLMPYINMTSHRFSNHVKVIQTLIKHSKSIGVVPDSIQRKINFADRTLLKASETIEEMHRRKKKRRSDVFSGLRKIVESVRGSTEHLESSFANDTNLKHIPCTFLQPPASLQTPLSNKPKIQKFSSSNAFSATKRCRISLGTCKQQMTATIPNKTTSNSPIKKRRWSFVAPTQSKLKRHSKESILTVQQNASQLQSESLEVRKVICENPINAHTNILRNQHFYTQLNTHESEYEAIRERVTAIEECLSHEITKLNQTLFPNTSSNLILDGPNQILSKYDQMAQETAEFLSETTDKLAQRLGQDLKLRRSSDHKVFRSPSARKIGIIRRRSQDSSRLRILRTRTFNADSDYQNTMKRNFKSSENFEKPVRNQFENIKLMPKRLKKQNSNGINSNKQVLDLSIPKINAKEEWTSGEIFFEKKRNIKVLKPEPINTEVPNLRQDVFFTPKRFDERNASNSGCMLPPKSALRRALRTPNFALTPDLNESNENGRASIARLRAQNAGSVLAKAKLFDGLEKALGK